MAEQVKLAYRESGDGENILLLHGFCGNKDYWKEVEGRLLPTHHVVVADMRGHGETEATEPGYSIHDMAEDVFALIKEKGLDDVFVFGHSMGGYITLDLAKNHPDVLAGYGLIHSTAFPDTEDAKKKRSAGVSKVIEQGVDLFVKELVPNLVAEQTRENNQAIIHKLFDIGIETNPNGVIGALKAMRDREDLSQVLEDGRLPVLLVAGAQDKVVPPEKTFITNGSHVTQELIADSGHMGIFETPDEVSHAIASFVNEHSKK